MPSESSFPNVKRGLFKLGWLGLLGVIPILILTFGLERELAREFHRHQSEEIRKFEYSLNAILAQEIVSFALRVGIGDIYGRILATPAPHQAFRKYKRELQNLFPGFFELVYFDANSRLVADCSDLQEFHPLLRDFGPEFMQCHTGQSDAVNLHLGKYRRFLGPFCDLFSPQSPWECRQVSPSKNRAYLVLPSCQPGKPWFMALVSFPRDPREFGFRFLRAVNQIRGESGIVDLETSADQWGKAFGKKADLLPQVMTLLGDLEGRAVSLEGSFWAQIIISPQRRLIVSNPDETSRTFGEARLVLRGAGVAVIGLLALLSLLGSPLRLHALSLKTRLLLLFFYTTGIPLALLLLCARGLFIERRQLLEKQVFQEQVAAMKEFDRCFTDYLSWIEAFAKKERGQPLPNGGDATAIAIKKAQTIVATLRPDVAELIDESGQSLLHSAARNRVTKTLQGVAPMVGIQVKTMAARRNRTEVSLTDAARIQAGHAIAETMGFDADEFTSHLSGGVNAMVRENLGGLDFGLMILQFFNEAGKLRFGLFLGWGDYLEDHFILRRLSRFQNKLTGISLGTTVQKRPYLLDFPIPEHLAELELQISQQSAPAQIKVEKNGQTFLASAILGRQVKRPFFACSTDTRIRREMTRTEWRLWATGVYLLSLGLGIGFLLSRHLLRPVELLSMGMECVKKRDFKVRLPVLSSDELGRLSDTFNRMLENMGDLELARIVQETFFPQEPLAGKGWEIFGTSVSASRVGGDYFDYWVLPDGRWLVLIGDVAGHGVGAALVVAMAKAVISHPDNPASPAEILSMLSRQVFQVLNGKRLMSCLLGFFDPASRTLVAANAGHNYPFLVRADGSEEWKLRSTLLGTRIRKPYEDHRLVLSRDETICFYTDGVVEAHDRAGQEIGYERFSAALPHLTRGTARESEQAIRSWFQGIVAPGPQEDDITLLILKKSPAPDSLV